MEGSWRGEGKKSYEKDQGWKLAGLSGPVPSQRKSEKKKSSGKKKNRSAPARCVRPHRYSADTWLAQQDAVHLQVLLLSLDYSGCGLALSRTHLHMRKRYVLGDFNDRIFLFVVRISITALMRAHSGWTLSRGTLYLFLALLLPDSFFSVPRVSLPLLFP